MGFGGRAGTGLAVKGVTGWWGGTVHERARQACASPLDGASWLRATGRDMHRRLWAAASVIAFVGTLLSWMWLVRQHFSPSVTALAIVGPVVLVFPVAVAGRRILDAAPTPERAEKITRVVHAWLVLLFGIGVITAIQTASAWRGLILPVPHLVAAFLVYATGAVGLLTVLNLALPTLATSLHASAGELQWFIAAYSLVLAAMLLPAARRFHRRQAPFLPAIDRGNHDASVKREG